jgi:cyclopropane fatty-acyl-phospholipid synthase-like methyltransferase
MSTESSGGGNWLQRAIFGILYRIGVVPWDGHPLPARTLAIANASPKGRALDVGCGTGDTSIYLARAGWDVTGVDFVDTALKRARAKAAAAGVTPRLLHADVTRLRESGVGDGFRFIVDHGCFHGFSDAARDAYAREINAVAAPGARMIIAGFGPGKRRGPPGFNRADLESRFGERWEINGGEIQEDSGMPEEDPIMVHELRLKDIR